VDASSDTAAGPRILHREYLAPLPAADDEGRTPAYAALMTAVNVRTGAQPVPRRALLVDSVVAAALAALLTLGTSFAARHQPGHRPFDAGAIALVALAAGVLAWRRRYPAAVLVGVFGAILVYRVLGYADGPVWVALVVAYVTAVVRGQRLAAAVIAAAGFGIFPWLDSLLRDGPAPSLASLTALAAWLLVLLGAAEAIRIRRERAAEAARIREEEALRRASEERLRIARELHDALGHHLSLINVQSGVALHLNEELPEPARNSLAAIKQASKEALSELRSVLDILRQEGEPAPRSPTSTLTRLDDLVSQTAAGGLEVRTETRGQVRPLPFAVDAAAFRIVQEALTNVTRHAGPVRATVRVIYRERDLTVQVDDDGRGTLRDSAVGVGKGIVGMRERVAALGGELQAGPRPGGGFRVRARLPLDRAP
jgi:signal transduction histidine kinase